MAQYNQYYLSNSANFHEAIGWATEQAKKKKMTVTAYCVIQSERILKANSPHEWDTVYNFAQSAASTMRLGLLEGTNLIRIFNPESSASWRENLEAFRMTADPPDSQGRMNADNLLASNVEETRLFYSHFDALYTYHRIRYRARAAGEQQPRNVTGQMIVVNTHSNVVWHIKSALYFEMDGRRVTMARPYIAVKRYDPVEVITAFVVTRPDDDDDKNLDYDKMVEEMEKIKL